MLPELDFVLVMSVNPGFGGQQFLPLCLPKIAHLARLRAELGLQFKIQVDGGVVPANTEDLVRAGADILVAGSAIFGGPHPLEANVAAFRTAIDAAF